MKLPISPTEWQTLLFAYRNGVCSGRQLRIYPNRRTKDGSFLKEFVTQGLLQVVQRRDKNGTPTADLAAVNLFQTTYKLTPEGQEAALTGEYECSLKDSVRVATKIKQTPLEQRASVVLSLVKNGTLEVVKDSKNNLARTYKIVLTEDAPNTEPQELPDPPPPQVYTQKKAKVKKK